MYQNNISYPIDLVYLWCDGHDPAFKARKAARIAKQGEQLEAEAIGSERFFDNEELRYSLRSVSQNIPWVHHIFVVTDRQQPEWINNRNPKLTVIDHSQILPEHLIPCYDASVIERYIYKIPGLQEYFLYANDDCFVGAPLEPGFFFQGKLPIVRVKKDRMLDKKLSLAEVRKAYGQGKDIFNKTLFNSWQLLYAKYNRQEFYKLHHNIDSYTKTIFQHVLERYKKEFAASEMPFRNGCGIQRVIIGLDAVYNKEAVLQEVPQFIGLQKRIMFLMSFLGKRTCDSYSGRESRENRRAVRYLHPKLFCINASPTATAADKKASRDFMKELFPEPSPLEK